MSRSRMALIAVPLLIAAIFAFLLIELGQARKEASRLSISHKELLAHAARYRELDQTISGIEARGRAAQVTGIVEAIDRIFTPLGIKDKVKSVKNLPPGAGIKEDRAEVSIQAVSMNELVNALYSIETAPMLLVVQRASIRASFERKDALNVTLTLSLVNPQ